MAVRPDVAGTGQTGRRPLRRPEPTTADGAQAENAPAPPPSGATSVDATAAAAPSSPAADPASGALPRWLLLLLGAAAATVAVGGLRAIAWLVAPVFLALVVVIALTPVQRWLRRIGAPSWLATAVLLILVWSILLSFVALLVLSIAQLAALLPDYADRAQVLINGVVNDLNDAGIVSGQLSDLVAQIDYSQLVGVATGLLSGLTDAASTLVLLLTALVFVAIESSGFGRRMALVAAERPHLPVALSLFTQGTRSYLLVSTVFGGIVAVGDWVALSIIGIPAAGIWGLLAFVTNYVPNIGFVLGVVPPALLGLLAGGWGELIAVVVVYALLNFVVQTLIQPRFVGDSVGLSMTVTFCALLFWGWVMGALGALLAIPLTLLVKVLLVDLDPRGHWLDAVLREEPRAPRTMRAKRRMHARRAALASVRRLHHPRRGHAGDDEARPG
ncbi:AI-2E family transporter [Blastococcus sp. CT_GayMR16]|uniref:AI-2E family transporter n=1 Tax=Blastococcus sp. CT_GayMR16 TaxID=2559607 RepID=UPI001073E389|nr:AI-2E family transporter [Blastococcus sp. CT_GayMR16]TFV85621.1 AI-2E family transporter [Blastococcus sp. CT_GayMR16]